MGAGKLRVFQDDAATQGQSKTQRVTSYCKTQCVISFPIIRRREPIRWGRGRVAKCHEERVDNLHEPITPALLKFCAFLGQAQKRGCQIS